LNKILQEAAAERTLHKKADMTLTSELVMVNQSYWSTAYASHETRCYVYEPSTRVVDREPRL